MKLQEIASQLPLVIELVRGLLDKGVPVYWGHNKVIEKMNVGNDRTMLSFIRPNGRVVAQESRYYSIEHASADRTWDLSNLDGDWKLHTTREGVGGNLDESVEEIETPLLMVLANNLLEEKHEIIGIDVTVQGRYRHKGSIVYFEIRDIPKTGLESNKQLIGTRLDKCVHVDFWKMGNQNKTTSLMIAIEDFDEKYELVKHDGAWLFTDAVTYAPE
jgi:hypothetical protein